MPGNMDPLGQVAQILGVKRAVGVRGQESNTVEPSRRKQGDATLVNVSHSGSALADMASRLRAVGFVHNPSGVEHQDHRAPGHRKPSREGADTAIEAESRERPRRRLKRFAESDENNEKAYDRGFH